MEVHHRRRLLAALGAALATARTPATTPSTDAALVQLSSLEQEIGGRIGLAALDTGSGVDLGHRADERFAMCSTFKLMLAAAVLARVDAGELHLDQTVRYGRADLLSTSPVSAAHVESGALSIEALAQAVVEVSDNTAANQLLALIGGPPGYTSYVRSIGDTHTRLDRIELALNSNLPGDARDTTLPSAMLADMTRTLTGNALSAASRERLLQWMKNCQTGRERLRAQLPAGWEAGDKTGTGARGAVNDLAILWPPKRAPILIACYLTGSERPTESLNGVHARIGALVARTLS
jgi:beta-lactamase class A